MQNKGAETIDYFEKYAVQLIKDEEIRYEKEYEMKNIGKID